VLYTCPVLILPLLSIRATNSEYTSETQSLSGFNMYGFLIPMEPRFKKRGRIEPSFSAN
jgi:hypothetical protein